MSIIQALAIGGSDSTGGAGIQADLKTFHAHDVYGLSVVTSVTAQNTSGVQASYDLPLSMIQAQLEALFSDFEISAAKTGMLSNSETISALSAFFSKKKLKLVVDPVMTSKSGFKLLKEDAFQALKSSLFPLALLVTPNLEEAEILSGMQIDSRNTMQEAAKKIHDYGPAVLIKGGHAWFEKGTDLFFDGKVFEFFKGDYVENKKPHGTGCVFSASITAHLAQGTDVNFAVAKAKKYIQNLIKNSISPGKGYELL